jgi:hypothetical protein
MSHTRTCTRPVHLQCAWVERRAEKREITKEEDNGKRRGWMEEVRRLCGCCQNTSCRNTVNRYRRSSTKNTIKFLQDQDSIMVLLVTEGP